MSLRDFFRSSLLRSLPIGALVLAGVHVSANAADAPADAGLVCTPIPVLQNFEEDGDHSIISMRDHAEFKPLLAAGKMQALMITSTGEGSEIEAKRYRLNARGELAETTQPDLRAFEGGAWKNESLSVSLVPETLTKFDYQPFPGKVTYRLDVRVQRVGETSTLLHCLADSEFLKQAGVLKPAAKNPLPAPKSSTSSTAQPSN